MKLKVGSRGSDLAVAQTKLIITPLMQELGFEIEMQIIKTLGDMVQDKPLREIEGRGYFTGELEEALLDERIDLAVHSFKDLPSKQPLGLSIAAVTKRIDPSDMLIIRKQFYDPKPAIGSTTESFANLLPFKPGITVGTSSVRRSTQLHAARHDLTIKDLRGNVTTRLSKLADRKYEVLILASAGIKRLKSNLRNFKTVRLEPERFIPAPGQGALAIQMRENSPGYESIRSALNDDDASLATYLEREVMNRFGGGCSLPLGVYARREPLGQWSLHGFWAGGAEPKWGRSTGFPNSTLIENLYQQLIQD